jgi:hypothetical protein
MYDAAWLFGDVLDGRKPVLHSKRRSFREFLLISFLKTHILAIVLSSTHGRRFAKSVTLSS